jgi:hypothetical protein
VVRVFQAFQKQEGNMKVNLYLASGNRDEFTRGQLLATADLEVVPGGTYIIDEKPYMLVGRPHFHINTSTNKPLRDPGPPRPLPVGRVRLPLSHELTEVDLDVLPVS